MRLNLSSGIVETRDNIAVGDTINVPVKIVVTSINRNETADTDGNPVEEVIAFGVIELPDNVE